MDLFHERPISLVLRLRTSWILFRTSFEILFCNCYGLRGRSDSYLCLYTLNTIQTKTIKTIKSDSLQCNTYLLWNDKKSRQYHMAFAFSWLFFSKDHLSKNIEDRNTSHSMNMRKSWLLSTTEMSSTIWGGKICFSYVPESLDPPQILQIRCDPHHSPPFVSLQVVKTSKVPGQLGRGGKQGSL